MAFFGYLLVSVFSLLMVAHFVLLIHFIYKLNIKYPVSMKIPSGWEREAELEKLRSKHKRKKKPSPLVLSDKQIYDLNASKNLLNLSPTLESVPKSKSLPSKLTKGRFVTPGQLKAHRSFIMEAATSNPTTYRSDEGSIK